MKKLMKLTHRARLWALATVLALNFLSPLGNVLAAGEGFSTVVNKTGQKAQSIAINDLQVTGTGNEEIVVTLFVPSGALTLGSTTNVVAVGNGSNNIQLSGYTDDINASLATLSFVSADSGTFTVDVTLGGGDGVVYNPANGHVYQITPADPDDDEVLINWTNAKIAAESKTYGDNHVPGYLATITTQQEHDFVMQRVTGDGWIGASDSAVEGQWRWVAGPEGLEDSGQGRLFWTGLGNGTPTPGQFTNWATNEPNDTNDDEDCAQLRTSAGGKWNDLPCTTSLPFYIVEYGQPGLMPEVATTRFTISIAGESVAAEKGVELISSSSTGEVGNDRSQLATKSVSNDGRYVAFMSYATNLVPDDTNHQLDMFVKDRQTGVTTRVSTGANGEQANGESRWASISGNGQYVIFESRASNLVPNDTNGAVDVFRKNIATGAIQRVSVGAGGEEGNGDSGFIYSSQGAAISDDGNLIMFASRASNLVAGDTNNGHDMFLKNMTDGSIRLLSLHETGTQVGGGSAYPAISPNGAFAFFSHSSNLIAEDTDNKADMYRKNLSNDAYDVITRTDTGVISPQILLSHMFPSQNGRYVGFTAGHPLLAAFPDSKSRAYVRDIETGTTVLASSSAAGEDANDGSSLYGLSRNGRYALIISLATNLGLDTNKTYDLFVKDMQTGDITTVSLTDENKSADSAMKTGALSGDGGTVVMETSASNFKSDMTFQEMIMGQVYARAVITDNEPVNEGFVPENENAPTLPLEPEEDGAPNNGDGNVNGTRDADEDNVVSFVSQVSGKYTTIELDKDCVFTDARAIKESASTKDIGFDYDNGLTRFSARCSGESTQVRVFHYGVSAAELTLRKFNANSGTYFTVPDAIITEQTIDGQTVAIATYTIVDNGSLDLDSRAGVITDPIGLGRSVVGAPNTGLGGSGR